MKEKIEENSMKKYESIEKYRKRIRRKQTKPEEEEMSSYQYERENEEKLSEEEKVWKVWEK